MVDYVGSANNGKYTIDIETDKEDVYWKILTILAKEADRDEREENR